MRDLLLTVLELVFVLAALVGLAWLAGIPVALIAGGVLGAAACEYAARRPPPGAAA